MSRSPTDRLLESARNDRLHHALILYGPSPTTLLSVATRISKTLNCLNGKGDDNCTSCARIEKGVHPDVRMVSPMKDRKAISIEQIRGVIGDAGLRPYEKGVKVFIIDPAETMSGAAANSLLKTLEEPSRDTAFILLTGSPDQLLPTIRSRCQIISIRPEGDAEVEVEDYAEITEEILDRLSRFADERDYGALLGIAPLLLTIEDVRQGMALLATVLRDVVAGTADQRYSETILQKIPKRTLLDAAQRSVSGIASLSINADVRLLIEEPLMIVADGRVKS